ncbi:MAG: HD domain-containing protein [Candidatus Competibacteraceae bacterium]
MEPERLGRQIGFLLEIDKLKMILRQSHLIHIDRHENAAEHSWHVAVMALLLTEYADEKPDLLRVLQMLLIHDIVEIDAGDTYCYDEVDNQIKAEREQQAAQRIFGLLPEDQSEKLTALWQEFEAGLSREARCANAVDRLMPILHNYYTQGRSWQVHGVTKAIILARNSRIREYSPYLWQWLDSLLEDAVNQGYLPE